MTIGKFFSSIFYMIVYFFVSNFMLIALVQDKVDTKISNETICPQYQYYDLQTFIVQEESLPQNWFFDGEIVEEEQEHYEDTGNILFFEKFNKIPNNISIKFHFINNEETIPIWQDIYRFNSYEKAINFYQEEIIDTIQNPIFTDFQSEIADEITFYCKDEYYDKTCYSIARYGCLVSRTVTLKNGANQEIVELEDLLYLIDKRLFEVLQNK